MSEYTEPILPSRGWWDWGREKVGLGPSQYTLDYEKI